MSFFNKLSKNIRNIVNKNNYLFKLKNSIYYNVKKAKYEFLKKNIKHPVISIDEPIPNFISTDINFLYNISTGIYSKCDIFCEHDPIAPTNSVIKLNYIIKKNDHNKNWITVFHIPFNEPISLINKYGLVISSCSKGIGGEFRILLEDNEGNSVYCSNMELLSSTNYQNFIFPVSSFKRPFWEKDNKNEFNWNKIKRFGFYIGCGYNIAPIRSNISLSSIHIAQTMESTNNELKELVIGDFNLLTEISLPEYYWWGAGEDSSLDIIPDIDDTFGLSKVLHLHYKINSENSLKNWISIKHHDLKTTLNLNNYDFISFWIRSNGNGGQLRIYFIDKNGNKAKYLNQVVMNGKTWQKLIIPISDIKDEAKQTDISNILSYDINIGLDWNKPPIEGDIFFTDKLRYNFSKNDKSELRLLKTNLNGVSRFVMNQFHLEEQNSIEKLDNTILQIGNFSELNKKNITDHYWKGSGDLSTINMFPNEEDDFGINGILRVLYKIQEDNSDNNWITFKHKNFDISQNWSNIKYLTFWIKGDGQGGHFRITIKDINNNKMIYTNKKILNNNYWEKLEILIKDLEIEKDFNISKIKSYEFYIGLDWKKPPIEGKILFSNLPRYSIRNDDLNKKIQKTFVTSLKNNENTSIEKKVYIGDFNKLNESNCMDHYWWGAGKDSSLKVVTDVIDEFGIKNTIYLTYSIDSDDSNENWITLKRREFKSFKNWKDIDKLSFWIRGDGQGGHFRILIRDENNNELVYSDHKVMNRNFWVELNISIDKFVCPKWKDKTKNKFDITKVKNYEFYIGLDWKKPPINGYLYLSNFTNKQLLKTTLQDSDKRIYVNLYDSLKITDVSKLTENFWWNNGPESFLKLTPNAIDPQGISGPLKIEYSIDSDNSNKNWIVIKHNNFNEPINWSFAAGVSLWIKGDSSGGQLRLSLEDKKGNKAIIKDVNILNSNKWQKWTALFTQFENSKEFSFTEIKNYEFYIGLDWKKPPVKSTIFFHDFSAKYKPELKSEKGSYNSFHNALIKEKYNKPSIIKIKKASKKIRRINLDSKLISQREFNKLVFEKYGEINNISESLEFSSKDICIKNSKDSNKWGLDKVAMFIEPTNLCNLQCIMCNHGDFSFDRGLGVMKFQEFKKLIDEIVKEKLNLWELVPQWLGETFIHPQIGDFIDYASKAKTKLNSFRKFNVHTNGAILEDKHIELILNSKLDSILFSLDGVKKETYDKIRIGGDFDKVVKNIETLIKLRNKRGQTHPKIIVQFIVMDENHTEIKEFTEFWRKRGLKKVIYAGKPEDNPFEMDPDVHLLFPQVEEDAIFIKSLEPNALTKHQTHREIIPDVSKVKVRRPCASLWRMFSIAWDGNATACCRDDQVTMGIGNVFDKNLKDVWYSEELRKQRIAHILGNFQETPKCQTCVNWIKNYISDEDIIDYLTSIGEKDLIKIYLERMKGENKG